MDSIRRLFMVFYGPRLIGMYKNDHSEGKTYRAGLTEVLTDSVVSTVDSTIYLCYNTWPLVIPIIYKCGLFTSNNILYFSVNISLGYTVCFILRGIARLFNPEYTTFIKALVNVNQRPSIESRRELEHYDFEFWAWPVDFRWNEGEERMYKDDSHFSPEENIFENSSIFTRVFSYLAMHSFGRRMIFPGATSFANYIMRNTLNEGRAQKVEEENGRRAKLLTEGNMHIDTMFMDRREVRPDGYKLVVCCQGNNSYYEIQDTDTPLELGFSVLYWNHPGFGQSSGDPSPLTEQKAIDAVMQYAIHKLDFPTENIVLYGWSIGGYTACWAAATYPDVGGVILDATFDGLLPLAVNRMPKSWEHMVTLSIRTYMNLNNGELLLNYPGPVLLIRRTIDNVISTEFSKSIRRVPIIASNRGNVLLLKLLQHRYPTIVDETTLPTVTEFLGVETSLQGIFLQDHGVDFKESLTFFNDQVGDQDVSFPMQIDVDENFELKIRLTLYLATVHMESFDSSHSAYLPTCFIHLPWCPKDMSHVCRLGVSSTAI